MYDTLAQWRSCQDSGPANLELSSCHFAYSFPGSVGLPLCLDYCVLGIVVANKSTFSRYSMVDEYLLVFGCRQDIGDPVPMN